MFKKILLLMMLGFSLVAGGFWALKAQDPSTVRTDPPTVAAVQTDLSGTYTGRFNCEAIGLTGDTTITINGNEFTTADGKTGRIVATTTSGYTAVAFQLNATDPTAPPQVISLRARKAGTRLTLMPVAGAPAGERCSFVPSRTVARGRRNQRTQPTVPAATGTEVANPAAVPSPAESPMPSQTPSPSPTPSPTPSPSEPMPSPTPSPGEPMPSPTPSPGEPMPSPTPTEPMPSPTPSPTPSPSPRSIRG